MAQLAEQTLDIPSAYRGYLLTAEEWLETGGEPVGQLSVLESAIEIEEPARPSVEPPTQDVELLRIREAAHRLGVHENTIRNWIERGLLKFVQLPGSGYRRLRGQDVERLRAMMFAPFSTGLSEPLGHPDSEPSRGSYKGGGRQMRRRQD